MSGYVEALEPDDDVYTVDYFISMCERTFFIDYDGHGHPVRGDKLDPTVWVHPSERDKIPADATHVVWYNR